MSYETILREQDAKIAGRWIKIVEKSLIQIKMSKTYNRFDPTIIRHNIVMVRDYTIKEVHKIYRYKVILE